MAKVVLCQEGFPSYSNVASRCSRFGLEIIVLNTLEELKQFVATNKGCLFCLTENQIKSVPDLGSGKVDSYDSNSTVLLAENSVDGIISMSKYQYANALVSSDPEWFVKDVNLIQSVYKSKKPLCKRLLSEESHLVEIPVNDYSKKDEYLRRISEMADELNCFDQFSKYAAICAWELMMNAIFDVIYEPDDLLSGIHKVSEDILLGTNSEVRLSFGYDNEKFVVSVMDQFGTLKVGQLKKNLADCFGRKKSVNLSSDGGAGMGIFMVMNYCNAMHFFTVPGESTEIAAVFYREKRLKKFRMRTKSLNLVSAEV